MQISLAITQPDDFHLHLRDALFLQHTVCASSRYFSRAIIMPNLTPPITHTQQASAYKARIQQWIPKESNFTPLMTLYLTDTTQPAEIRTARQSGDIFAVKWYPAGATTNSQLGITDINKMNTTLEALIDNKLPLLIHGETTHSTVDIFDREKYFLDNQLYPIIQRYPELRIVLEHITTQEAVSFIREASPSLAATITPQHLLFNRNDLLVKRLNPHLYCLPILKRATHQQALIKAATSGSPEFFLGTDSAPHTTDKKESNQGCAGCFSAPHALELYAEIFDQHNALNKLEGFASHYGADFYQLPRNTKRIQLVKKPFLIPDTLPVGINTITPLHAGHTLSWTVLNEPT
ncbi:MAG: dihydroorotase [Endozoicomonadaceae bacterium]|nr:dihydroorotase [Endozoicomonadaceae bacterium]